jgi:hypothetical protein
MFSVMWSEHCSYKSSRPLLRTLPTGTEADGVVAGPGENAGVILIGDGLAVAFKIESHNHPSAVEPTQGAATGVGGILRDIFTMGARPIAVLDASGSATRPDARTRHLVEGVVKGVGGYGNCVGVPTIGGELVFDPSTRATRSSRDGDRPARSRPTSRGPPRPEPATSSSFSARRPVVTGSAGRASSRRRPFAGRTTRRSARPSRSADRSRRSS